MDIKELLNKEIKRHEEQNQAREKQIENQRHAKLEGERKLIAPIIDSLTKLKTALKNNYKIKIEEYGYLIYIYLGLETKLVVTTSLIHPNYNIAQTKNYTDHLSRQVFRDYQFESANTLIEFVVSACAEFVANDKEPYIADLKGLIDQQIQERERRGYKLDTHINLWRRSIDGPRYYAGMGLAERILPIVYAGIHKFASTISKEVKEEGTRGGHGKCLAAYSIISVTSRGFLGKPKEYKYVLHVEVGHSNYRYGQEIGVTALLISGCEQDEDIPPAYDDDGWLMLLLAKHYANGCVGHS